jgi:hypothetical protein
VTDEHGRVLPPWREHQTVFGENALRGIKLVPSSF